MAFLLAITINILILVSFTRTEEGEVVEANSSAINIVGVIIIILSSIIVAYFLAKTAPLLIAKAWKGAK